MPYYHDPANKVVAFAPDAPNVIEPRPKKNSAGSWIVSMRVDYTNASNYIDPKTHQWRYPVCDYRKEQYDAQRDSREAAIRWFRVSQYPNLPVVEFEEYKKYKAIYQAEADNNDPSEERT